MAAMGRGEVSLDDVGLGSVLARRYRLEDRRHDGPDGSVWRAVDETLERRVMVRVMPTDHPRTADVVDAARRAALIEDSRLIRILDVGESGAVTYIVTEHVPGETLSERLSTGPIAAESARRLVGEVALALDAAAGRGLHHLHLDPTVVVVTPDGAVKLSGLAIEAAIDGSEAEAADVASATDARGLSHLLYACLTGRWPGDGDGGLDVAPVVGGRPVGPGDLVAGVPADLEAVCADDTLPDPAAVAAALQPWAAEKPLTQPRGLNLGGPVRPPAPAPRSEATVWNLPEPAVPPQATASPVVPSEPPTSVPAGADDDDPARTAVSAEGDQVGPDDEPPQAPGDRPTAGHDDGRSGPPAQTPPASPFGFGGSTNGSSNGAAGLDGTGPTTDDPSSSLTAAGHDQLTPPVPAWRPAAAGAGVPAEAVSYTGLLTPPPTPVIRPDLGTELLGGPATQPLQRLEPNPARPLSDRETSAPVEWRPAWAARREVDDEALGPFMPQAPVGRPTDNQARTVIVVMAGLVVLGLSGSAGSPAGGGPITIASVLPLDPFGDLSEHPESAAMAIDHDPSTSWRSEGYGSAAFGGRKKGLGLDLALGSRQTVRTVTVDAQGTGGTLEIHGLAADQKSAAASVLGAATMTDGRTVVTLTQPLTTDHIVVWFTAVTRQAGGEYKLVISEVSLS